MRRCGRGWQSKVSDWRVLALVEAFLQQPIFEGLAQWTADEGPRKARSSVPCSPICISTRSTTRMAAAGFEMVRYADDFVILCRTAEDAQRP